ncbi:MAG: ATP-binding protein [Rickettsiales bacterium]|jgi:general secretion pathway protein A|nr:ATP-binding protein [Rickettsiales bacterium]
MNYLQFFHFDRDPFPVNGERNYTFENPRQTRIVDDMAKRLRAEPGIYAIIGKNGSGKTTVLEMAREQVSQNDWAVMIRPDPKNDIMRTIADEAGIAARKADAGEALRAMANAHRRGMNAVVLIDDADSMTKKHEIAIASMLETLPYVKIVLAGGRGLKKNIAKQPGFCNKIAKSYAIRGLSFPAGVRYIRTLAGEALSLAQYTHPIGMAPAFLLSFVSNRNMQNINYIATETLRDAYRDGRHRTGIKNVWRAAKAHFDMVKGNIYLKFQKMFTTALILLCAYYTGKMIVGRFRLMRELEAHESIKEQEKLLVG